MDFGIEIALAPSGDNAASLTAMARAAEAAGLDLIVLSATDADGPDLWATAVWLLGSTSRIALGTLPPPEAATGSTDASLRLRSVAAKARDSIEALAPARLLTDSALWAILPVATDAAALRAAAPGRIAVLPASSLDDIARIAALAESVRGPATGRRRTSAARSRRLPGIDYDGVPAVLADRAVEPGDANYRSVASTYMRSGSPGLVLRPTSNAELADALAFARRHRDIPLGIRSVGHGISGRSTNSGGLVIDVGAFNEIRVLSENPRRVRVGPGATWKQVNAAIASHGWAIGSGDYGGVGVGGLATAGGLGFLSRQHGLTIDSLTAVELVLADGTALRVDRDHEPELFWAMRGAGANFGIATAFEFEPHVTGKVGWAQFVLVTEDLASFLYDFGQLIAAAPRDTTIFLVTGQPRQGRNVVQLYGIVDSDDPDTIIARLTPFVQLAPLADQQLAIMRYTDVMNTAADVGDEGHQGGGEPASRSGLLPVMTRDFARDAAELINSGKTYFFQFRAMGGAIADVPAGATAFSHRDAALQVGALGASDRAINPAWDDIRRKHLRGNYLSFETDRRPERLLEAFPPPVLARLVALKRRFDPDNLFRDNFNIDPDLDIAPLGASTLTEAAK
ncbi:MAG: FAD-binding oxidoreductase [Hyphomicrobiales bacterium]|nr:MAG: FAD-binding oxidoreductase [Hyphomicrobiales bacterium]